MSARNPPPGNANMRADEVICLPFQVRSLTSPVLCNSSPEIALIRDDFPTPDGPDNTVE
ncbi:MAG: hypothetical protein LW818_03600 [Ignavibacteriae bacterium]|nr:hypothetical protein [Ignavibacteriota bacterium]